MGWKEKTEGMVIKLSSIQNLSQKWMQLWMEINVVILYKVFKTMPQQMLRKQKASVWLFFGRAVYFFHFYIFLLKSKWRCLLYLGIHCCWILKKDSEMLFQSSDTPSAMLQNTDKEHIAILTLHEWAKTFCPLTYQANNVDYLIRTQTQVWDLFDDKQTVGSCSWCVGCWRNGQA